MPADDSATGWYLHSHAQGRKFGPLDEDELRRYFRAGMVKSVDRLSAPGQSDLLAAAQVAEMIGETAPVGPPPPEPEPSAEPVPPSSSSLPPRPPVAGAVPPDVDREARAARAAAAMNIDIAALMATSAPAKKRQPWLVPTLAVLVMVVLMLVGLNMVRKMKPPPSDVSVPGVPMPDTALVNANAAAPSADPAVFDAPQAAEAAASPDEQDGLFNAQLVQAEKLKNAKDWSGLGAFAKSWSESQPDRNEPLQYLAVAYTSQSNFAQAEAVLKQLLARDPGSPATRMLLADTYMQSRRYDEAVAIYKAMTSESPNEARVWNNYGAALNATGQPAQAIAAVENAVRIDPGFKQAWANLGNLYQATGDSAKASAAFARAR